MPCPARLPCPPAPHNQLCSGKAAEGDVFNTVWVVDSNTLPFNRAEQYHQFHNGIGEPEVMVWGWGMWGDGDGREGEGVVCPAVARAGGGGAGGCVLSRGGGEGGAPACGAVAEVAPRRAVPLATTASVSCWASCLCLGQPPPARPCTSPTGSHLLTLSFRFTLLVCRGGLPQELYQGAAPAHGGGRQDRPHWLPRVLLLSEEARGQGLRGARGAGIGRPYQLLRALLLTLLLAEQL